MSLEYMFGADPECFLTVGNTLIPAWHFLPNTGKGNCLELGRSGGVHFDNVMLELNPTPSTSLSDVSLNCHELCYAFRSNVVPEYMKDFQEQFAEVKGIQKKKTVNCMFAPFYALSADADVLYDSPHLYSFGCEPDYNAYTKKLNPPVDLPKDIRVAGGHLMISAQDERLYNPDIVFNAVRWMDILVMGTILAAHQASGALSQTWMERENKRRAFYGKAGSFRPKKFPDGYFGIEYRVPSSSWLLLNEVAITNIQKAMVDSVEKALALELPPQLFTDEGGEYIINELDHTGVKFLLEADW